MSRSTDQELLEELFVQVERAWYDRGDRDVVDKLVREHPQFRRELEEFSDDLVHEFDEDEYATPETIEAEDRVYEWLQAEGIDEALKFAAAMRQQPTSTGEGSQPRDQAILKHDSSPKQKTAEGKSESWIRFLSNRTERKKGEIASLLPNVNIEFLSLVSRHPEVVPDGVKLGLARSVQEAFRIPEDQSMRCLKRRAPPIKRAASAKRLQRDDGPTTFEEVLERSSLPEAQKDFWRRCAGGTD